MAREGTPFGIKDCFGTTSFLEHLGWTECDSHKKKFCMFYDCNGTQKRNNLSPEPLEGYPFLKKKVALAGAYENEIERKQLYTRKVQVSFAGLPGVGKTTVCKELKKLGEETVEYELKDMSHLKWVNLGTQKEKTVLEKLWLYEGYLNAMTAYHDKTLTHNVFFTARAFNDCHGFVDNVEELQREMDSMEHVFPDYLVILLADNEELLRRLTNDKDRHNDEYYSFQQWKCTEKEMLYGKDGKDTVLLRKLARFGKYMQSKCRVLVVTNPISCTTRHDFKCMATEIRDHIVGLVEKERFGKTYHYECEDCMIQDYDIYGRGPYVEPCPIHAGPKSSSDDA